MSYALIYKRKKPYPETKISKVQELSKLLKTYRNILLISIRDVSANQMKELRAKIWGKGVCKVVKNTLARIAIDNASKERKELSILRDHLTDMHAFVFTNQDPFEIAQIVDSIKEARLLKPGKIAPIDVVIQKGFTGFKPGPELSEIRMAGIPVRILDGEVFITENYTLVRAGQVVSPYAARVMALLDIKPLKIGPKVILGLIDNTIVRAEILLRPLEEYFKDIQVAVNEGRTLAIEAKIPVPEVTEDLISVATKEALNLATEIAFISPETIPELIGLALIEIISLLNVVKDYLPVIPEELKALIPTALESKSMPPTKEENIGEEKKEEKKEKKEEETLAGLSLLF
ncbi:MAG: 50S ribosomal protein L10 [Candidatus Korarchaeota archaeon]|nr:50S ribosomal protein L10 [Thermoproteota archaeon]